MNNDSKKTGDAGFNKLSESQTSTLVQTFDFTSSRIISDPVNRIFQNEEYIPIDIEWGEISDLWYIKHKSKWYSSA